MNIPNPRRILFLGPPNSGTIQLIQELTGSAPTTTTTGSDSTSSNSDSSTAGLSHTWHLTTPYYQASIPIWIDEILHAEEWRQEFHDTPGANEVLDVLGAWVFCFRRPVGEDDLKDIRACLSSISSVRQSHHQHGGGGGGGLGSMMIGGGGEEEDNIFLAVAMPQSITPYIQKDFEEWEDIMREYGAEYIDFEMKGRNEFGEPTGLERIKEVLETVEWAAAASTAADGYDDDELDDKEGGDEKTGFDVEANELEREMFGMRNAIHDDDDGDRDGFEQEDTTTTNRDEEEDEASQVEQLEVMMLKMQAVRDTSADLPEKERRKVAAKAIGEIMRNF